MSGDALQALLEDGVSSGVFPSAQARVLVRGRTVFEGHAGGVSGDTRFDLASLTKVLGTTAAFMSLWSRGELGPRTLVARFFPGSPAGINGVTLEDLLFHRSGLPAYTPYFAAVLRAVPELLNQDVPGSTREEVRREVVKAASLTPLLHEPGACAVYSDVGFILLGEILALAAAQPLDALVRERVTKPLGMSTAFHRLSVPGTRSAEACAPTGTVRPREPAQGQEDFARGLASRPSLPGGVDDDNAWVMDGVAGHAGMFGTAGDVARFGQAILEELEGASLLAPSPLWERALARDASTEGSTRALGFDTPSGSPSSAGRYLGDRPPGAVGHLGFTGGSLWVDRARGLVVALCTNCTAPGRVHQPRIRAFRPRFHDAVVEQLGLA